MTVDNEKLVSQTFKMLGNLENVSKDEIASRARLLALALQQAERACEESEVHNGVLKEAMEQVLANVKDHMDHKFQTPEGGYVTDVAEVLKKALSPYADSAYARSLIKAQKEGEKARKAEMKAGKKAKKKAEKKAEKKASKKSGKKAEKKALKAEKKALKKAQKVAEPTKE